MIYRYVHSAIRRRGNLAQRAQGGTDKYTSLAHLPLLRQELPGMEAWTLAFLKKMWTRRRRECLAPSILGKVYLYSCSRDFKVTN